MYCSTQVFRIKYSIKCINALIEEKKLASHENDVLLSKLC